MKSTGVRTICKSQSRHYSLRGIDSLPFLEVSLDRRLQRVLATETKAERELEYWQVFRKSHVVSCVSGVQKEVMVVGLVADIACYDARVMRRSPCCVDRSSQDKRLGAMKLVMQIFFY